MTIKIQPSPTRKHGRQSPEPAVPELQTCTEENHASQDHRNHASQDRKNHASQDHKNHASWDQKSPDAASPDTFVDDVIYVTSQTVELDNNNQKSTDAMDQFTDIGTKSDTIDNTSINCDNSVIEWDSDDEAVDRSKMYCWGLCCMHGCIWGLIGAIYFFFLLPAGFLMILYGTNNNLVWAIAAGSAILGVSTCGVPSLCLWIRWYRRKRRDRRTEYRIQRDRQLAKVTFENPVDASEVIEVPA